MDQLENVKCKTCIASRAEECKECIARLDRIREYYFGAYSYRNHETENYNKTIIGLGYAGFLTFFSLNFHHLSSIIQLKCSIMILISIASFIFIEVIEGVIGHFDSIKLYNFIQKNDSDFYLAEKEYISSRMLGKPLAKRFWMWSNAISLVTGLLASYLLIESLFLKFF